MHSRDNEFFEEYKKLDKICGEMYSCQNGVSEYIDQMDKKYYNGQRLVPSWENDYKMLKHIRWVRNRIAHDFDSYQISEADDLLFVKDYYNRIFSGRDALTILRKKTENEKVNQKPRQFKSAISPMPESRKKKKSRGWIYFILTIIIILIIYLIFYFKDINLISFLAK